MTKILSIALGFFMCVPGFCQDTFNSSRTVRVLTYNIYHGATMKNDFNLESIARVIRSVSPDLVALQEVDFKTNRAKKMDLVTELGKLTGMAPLFGKAMSYDDGEYGEGILSNYSFTQTKNYSLSCSPGHEPRAALSVTISLPGSEIIQFVGTHLDHTRDQTDRVSQAKQINEIFSQQTIPTILAGDLNAQPGSDPINILTEFWTDGTAKNPQPTFPSSDPKKKIDYIMFFPENRWQVLETKVIVDKVASDHCGLLMVLRLLPEK